MSDELSTIERGAPEYPARLLDLEEPPELLYVRGSLGWLGNHRTVAIVGSRKASVQGVRLAKKIAADLGQAGIVVVSGGALGVDAAAHRGCLEANAPTISVLAGGVDKPTPLRNTPVFEQVVAHGALVSEYAPGTSPRRFHFHRRNELIAALGDATLVVRAGLKSGTMITARAAKGLGRPLCALPGALDDPLAEGCHKLLVEGAQCVRGASDILEYVFDSKPPARQLSLAQAAPPAPGPNNASTTRPAKRRAPFERAKLSDEGAQLLDTLDELADEGVQGVSLDQLKRALGWPPVRLNSALLELELAGAVAKCAGANAFRPL